jgi:excisionase family DNA binding protein
MTLKSNLQTYSVAEAARAMGFTLKYLYDLVHSGRITAKKVAGRWQIPASEVEARLAKRSER